MASMTISQAMKAIKDQQCCECRRQAKGLVYRGQDIRYYCKRCLHSYMEQKDMPVQEAVARPA